MLTQEVIATESDPCELNLGHPLAKIGNHRVLNGGVTQISTGIGGQKCDSRAWLSHSLASFSCDLWDFCGLHELHKLPASTNWRAHETFVFVAAGPWYGFFPLACQGTESPVRRK